MIGRISFREGLMGFKRVLISTLLEVRIIFGGLGIFSEFSIEEYGSLEGETTEASLSFRLVGVTVDSASILAFSNKIPLISLVTTTVVFAPFLRFAVEDDESENYCQVKSIESQFNIEEESWKAAKERGMF